MKHFRVVCIVGLLFCFYFPFSTALGQSQNKNDTTEKEVRIQPDQSYGDLISRSKRYRFPRFERGRMYFKDGNPLRLDLDIERRFGIQSKMNLDMASGLVVYINSNGDTLGITDNKIDYFLIAGFIFLNTELGSIELQDHNQRVEVGILRKYDFRRREMVNTGSYDATGSATAKMPPGLPSRSKYNSVLLKKTQYYFINKEPYRVIPANRKKVKNAYPEIGKKLESYLRKNKVDFKSEKDLRGLAHFLSFGY